MRTSETIDLISAALSAAQKNIRPAVKDSLNPHFKSRYADLAAIVDSVRVPLGENGLAVIQEAVHTELGVGVLTRILHASGQWLELGPLLVPVSKQDAHGVGSALTYAKRYALAAALNVSAEEDDDGNAAVGTARAPSEVLEPAGYREAKAALATAATQGSEKLKTTWLASSTSVRSYVTTHDPIGWAALKAEAVTHD